MSASRRPPAPQGLQFASILQTKWLSHDIEFSCLPHRCPVFFTTRRRFSGRSSKVPRALLSRHLYAAILHAVIHHAEKVETNKCFGRISQIPKVSRARRPLSRETARLLSAMQKQLKRRMLIYISSILNPQFNFFLFRLLNIFHFSQLARQLFNLQALSLTIHSRGPLVANISH